jgi:hypothetical protein
VTHGLVVEPPGDGGDTLVGRSEVAEQRFTHIQTSIGTSRAPNQVTISGSAPCYPGCCFTCRFLVNFRDLLVLDGGDGMSVPASTGDGDTLETLRSGVSTPVLSRVERDDVCRLGVVLPTSSQSDLLPRET